MRCYLLMYVCSSLLILLVGCQLHTQKASHVTSNSVINQHSQEVSLKALLTDPGSYHGKTIETKGYVVFEFEGDAIYLNHEEWSRQTRKFFWGKAIWLNCESLERPTSYGYATIVGIMDSARHGHMGIFDGEIDVHHIQFEILSNPIDSARQN